MNKTNQSFLQPEFVLVISEDNKNRSLIELFDLYCSLYVVSVINMMMQ